MSVPLSIPQSTLGAAMAYPPQASGGCSQATTFLARTSGLSGTETSAYTTLICGLVSDGNFSLFDALYIFATNSTTTAGLNVVSTSFTLTPHGTLTFSADNGYTGDGSTGWLDTGVTYSGTQFTQNSGSLGVYVLAQNSCGAVCVEIGATFPASFLQNQFTTTMQGFIGGSDSLLTTTIPAQWIITRTSSVVDVLYRNGSSAATGTSASTGLPTQSMSILAMNQFGGTQGDFSPDKLSAAWIGGAVNATQAGQIDKRINCYMTALGINLYSSSC